MKLDIEQRARSVQLEETMSIEELAFYAAWLEAERDRLRKALENLVDLVDHDATYESETSYDTEPSQLKTARAALQEADDE